MFSPALLYFPFRRILLNTELFPSNCKVGCILYLHDLFHTFHYLFILRFSFNHDTWAYFTVHHPFTTNCNIFVPYTYIKLTISYSKPLPHYPKRTFYFLISFPIYCNLLFTASCPYLFGQTWYSSCCLPYLSDSLSHYAYLYKSLPLTIYIT